MSLSLIVLSLAVAQMQQRGRALPAALDTAELSAHTVVLSADDGYQTVYSYVYPLLKRYDMTMTLGVVCQKVSPGLPSRLAEQRFLNRAEIQEMLDSCRIEVASHSLTHARLTKLDPAAAWREIVDSRIALESLFRVPVVTFIYPYGRTNRRVRNMVAQAGYGVARAVRPGRPDISGDPFRIPELELRSYVRLEDVQKHIQTHELTVILFHKIVPEAKTFTEWRLADFCQLLAWMHSHRVRVTTLARLYRDSCRTRLTKALLDRLEEAAEKRGERLFEQVNVDATRTLHPR